MKRRDLFTILAGAALAQVLPAEAEQAVPVIGYLSPQTADYIPELAAAFREGLKETGFEEGRNLITEYRFAEGRYDRLPNLVADLVARQVAVIVAMTPPATLAAKRGTTTVPIVFNTGSFPDPVEVGLVKSYSHPGGNVTGIVAFSALETKSLQLLTELIPKNASLAALVNPTLFQSSSQRPHSQLPNIDDASRKLGRAVEIVRASTEAELNVAFSGMEERHIGGLLVEGDPFFTLNREGIVGLAARHRIPAIYPWREFAAVGGLMSYGNLLTETYRGAGVYTGRILHGERPADMPVVQANQFKLVINLKAAQDLGLTIPPVFMTLADELIP